MAQQDTLATYIQREREDVQNARENLLAKRREIDEEPRRSNAHTHAYEVCASALLHGMCAHDLALMRMRAHKSVGLVPRPMLIHV
jgi:hypothetical protein